MSEKKLGSTGGDARRISPRFSIANWKRLNLTTPQSPDWDTAVEIFLDRIHGRFLGPIDAIRNRIDPEIAEFAGFVIIAIDCLVIETLVQFRNGEDETPRGRSQKAFWQFFSGSDFFKNAFDTELKSNTFYQHFRCGILHQAQTKKRSLVHYDAPEMVQLVAPGDLEEGLTIDRELFHQALVDEINCYAQRLRSPQNADDKYLRERFIKKMNFIVR